MWNAVRLLRWKNTNFRHLKNMFRYNLTCSLLGVVPWWNHKNVPTFGQICSYIEQSVLYFQPSAICSGNISKSIVPRIIWLPLQSVPVAKISGHRDVTSRAILLSDISTAYLSIWFYTYKKHGLLRGGAAWDTTKICVSVNLTVVTRGWQMDDRKGMQDNGGHNADTWTFKSAGPRLW